MPAGRCAITRICCWTWNPIPWRARRRRWTRWLPPLASFLSWTGCCRAFRYGDGGWRCLPSVSPSRLGALGALFLFLFNVVVHVAVGTRGSGKSLGITASSEARGCDSSHVVLLGACCCHASNMTVDRIDRRHRNEDVQSFPHLEGVFMRVSCSTVTLKI